METKQDEPMAEANAEQSAGDVPSSADAAPEVGSTPMDTDAPATEFKVRTYNPLPKCRTTQQKTINLYATALVWHSWIGNLESTIRYNVVTELIIHCQSVTQHNR